MSGGTCHYCGSNQACLCLVPAQPTYSEQQAELDALKKRCLLAETKLKVLDEALTLRLQVQEAEMDKLEHLVRELVDAGRMLKVVSVVGAENGLAWIHWNHLENKALELLLTAGVDESSPPYGRCDTCGAAVNLKGCSAAVNHNVANG